MKVLIQILILSLFISCGKDDKEDAVKIPDDKASKSDLATPSNPGTANESEMEGFMSDDTFLAKKSDKLTVKSLISSASSAIGGDASMRRMMPLEDSEDGFEKCFSVDAIKLEAKGDTITLKKSIDVESCLKPYLKEQAGSQATLNIPNASFGINMKIQCPGADLSSYNGKKFSEMGASAEEVTSVCEDGGAKLYLNMVGRIRYIVSLNENEIEAEADIKAIIAAKDGGNCALTTVTDGTKSDDCVHIMSSVANITTNGEKKVEREFQKIVFNDVVEPSDENATYFKSGTQTVTYRNWQGTVTHVGTGFSYNFTNGTDEVEGSRGTVPSTLN